jgi:hypothetical protein
MGCWASTPRIDGMTGTAGAGFVSDTAEAGLSCASIRSVCRIKSDKWSISVFLVCVGNDAYADNRQR